MQNTNLTALAMIKAAEKRVSLRIEAAKLQGERGKRGLAGAAIKGDKGDAGDSIKGDKGDAGKSIKGDKGNAGKSEQGKRGVAGKSIKGDKGDKGDSFKGERGKRGFGGESIKGDKGDAGPRPAHKWDGTKITVQDADGTWGKEVDLAGKPGANIMQRGGGGGISPKSVIYVTSRNQLIGNLKSDKVYLIDGVVDMQSTQIVVPAGGLNLIGGSLNTSRLQSSVDGYTMFIFDPASYSGDLLINNMEVEVTGTGAEAFDLDNKENVGRISWNTLNFSSCTSLGTIKSYSQALAQNIGWRDCSDGIIVDGIWGGGWAILNSIVLGADFTGTLFKAGDSLIIGGSFRSNINILKLDVDSGAFCDFAPSNITLDAGFTLSNVRVNPLADALPNMPSTSVKALIKDCVGLDNTYQGGSVTPNADSLITITTQDVYVQITGAVTLSDAYWFSVANTNGLKLDSSLPLDVRCAGILSFGGTTGAEIGIQLRKFVDADSAYTEIGPEYIVSVFGGVVSSLASNASFSANTIMNKDDRIEVWVRNKSNANNLTLKSGGKFEALER